MLPTVILGRVRKFGELKYKTTECLPASFSDTVT
jgi:hypothetical protein